MVSLLLVLAVWFPAGAGARVLVTSWPSSKRSSPVPVLTAAAVAFVAVGLAAQVAWPPWLVHLERTRDAVLAGEWWRLGTSLVAQDGGVGGGLSNLAALAAVGAVAERLLGRRRWALAAAAGVIAGQAAGMVMDASGAGNSIAVIALAASVAVDLLWTGSDMAAATAVSTVALFSGAGLVALHDLHGYAALAGAAAGLATRTRRVDPPCRRLN